jgi:hypothetical protein
METIICKITIRFTDKIVDNVVFSDTRFVKIQQE